MSEKYLKFKQYLKDNKPIPDYYHQLVEHTKDILIDISLSKQSIVAQELNLTPVKLSHLLPLLKELYYATH